MSTGKGYIKIYRDIRDHWIWSDAEAFKAWIDLIMMANHENTKIYFDGKLIPIKRGSFITSVRRLSARWGWGKDKTLRFLRTLEDEGMISRKCDTKKTLVTVEKYGFYQSSKSKSATLTGTQTRTQTRTQTSHSEGTKEGTKNTLKEDSPSDEAGKPWDAEGWE